MNNEKVFMKHYFMEEVMGMLKCAKYFSVLVLTSHGKWQNELKPDFMSSDLKMFHYPLCKMCQSNLSEMIWLTDCPTNCPFIRFTSNLGKCSSYTYLLN